MSKREQLRQKRLERQRRQRLTILLIAVSAVAIILAAIFLPQLFRNTAKLPYQDGFSIGDPNAPVKIEEFSDFRCSHCRDFSEVMEPDIIDAYIKTGKVQLMFINFAGLAADSANAAEAAYCAAEQNAFWEMKEILYKYNTYADVYEPASLVTFANQVGLDTNAFSACLDSDVHLHDIQNDISYGQQIGVMGTPSFIVNGILVYSDTLIHTIESELAKAGVN
ncbi:MAG: thioredoxin domain-containing protein [Chloroflexota bacterium]